MCFDWSYSAYPSIFFSLGWAGCLFSIWQQSAYCWGHLLAKSWMVFGYTRQEEPVLHPTLAPYSNGIQFSSEVEDHQVRVLFFQEEENSDSDKMCSLGAACGSLGLPCPGVAGCCGGSLVPPTGLIAVLQFILCPGARTDPKQNSYCPGAPCRRSADMAAT